MLGLVYMNGVGVLQDPDRATALLRAAAEHGHAAAAYVLAAELAQNETPAGAARGWLDRSAKAGYPPAIESLRSHRLPLARETAGASDPALLAAWVLDCARKGDAAELRRLGPPAAAVKDEFGRGALAYAVEAGEAPAATALLELGADPRAADRIGTTPLMLAAQRPDASLTQLLLQRGADPGAVDTDRRTALFYAASGNRPASVLARGASVPVDALDVRGYSALDAALIVDADAAAAALRSLNARSRAPSGAMSIARKVRRRHDRARSITAGRRSRSRSRATTRRPCNSSWMAAPTRIPGFLRATPFKVAADAHALGSLSLLLAHGADPSATDHAHHTTLGHGRAQAPHSRRLRSLLGAGIAPDAHAATSRGLVARDAARGKAGCGGIAPVFRPNADLADDEGHTPLMLAAAAGDRTGGRELIGRQAQVDAHDRQGRTALWMPPRRARTMKSSHCSPPGRIDPRPMTPGSLHCMPPETIASGEIVEALLTPDTLESPELPLVKGALIIAAASGQLPCCAGAARTCAESRPAE